MNDQSALSLTGALADALLIQTQMVNCTMHLFQEGFNPNVLSTLANFNSFEANYDGYSPKTIAAWADPVLAGPAYAIYAPTQTFRWTFDTLGTANMIGGYYLVTAGGVLKGYTVFGDNIPMAGAGQAVIKTPILVFPAG